MTKKGAQDNTNIFLEEGKQSPNVDASQAATESEATVSEHEEKRNILKAWTGTLVMIPLTIIISVFASTGNCYFAPGSFPHRSFFVAVAINFYSSVAGVILWNKFRRVGSGFLLMAFLSALVSVTILFGETLKELSSIPWILMVILILMVFYAGISSTVRTQN